jgi:hypothetical protein
MCKRVCVCTLCFTGYVAWLRVLPASLPYLAATTPKSLISEQDESVPPLITTPSMLEALRIQLSNRRMADVGISPFIRETRTQVRSLASKIVGIGTNVFPSPFSDLLSRTSWARRLPPRRLTDKEVIDLGLCLPSQRRYPNANGLVREPFPNKRLQTPATICLRTFHDEEEVAYNFIYTTIEDAPPYRFVIHLGTL